MKKISIIFVMMVFSAFQAIAQEEPVKEKKGVQVSFGYPVGSAGRNSTDYINNFSFNILYGINGGLNGAEIGGLMNVNDGNVNGFQMAGLMNMNSGRVKGATIAGLSNISRKGYSGVVVAGVLNYTQEASTGLGFSPANILTDSLTGAQIGMFNYADRVKGLQFGAFNYVRNSAEVQIGHLNYTREENGVQVGLFNLARKGGGVQVGLFNYQGEGEDGTSIGLFNIVKDGYYALEVSANESIFANLAYKMGTEKFYTIFTAGYSSYNSKPVYSTGLGFGGMVKLAENQRLAIDATANNVVYDNNWDTDDDGINLLNKLDLSYRYRLGKFSAFAGPSLNVYVTRQKVDGRYGTINIPYTLNDHESDHTKVFMWVGFNAGLSLRL
ncbi:hypothetical protein FUAX_33370 [Fulvitalea axinellae]|uniref:DUF5723 domain-containing protein n=1 Tax=Fulvitalea axinellae TaxID=1182444 RepID=A0AAU9DEJ2_9BACT|nr:hypothetical protein FUAX_33370 [Fulvitalea axinellae]